MKTKAIAIAIPQHSFHAAFTSARNFSLWLADCLYGTDARTQRTLQFAMGIIILGFALSVLHGNAAPACAV